MQLNTIRWFVVGGVALVLAACGSSEPTAAPLEDVILGDPNAPITLVEYGSLGCPTCQVFHMNTLPQIKEEYIDTGKVNYVFREFRAGDTTLFTTGSLFSRCVESSQYYNALDIAFTNMNELYQSGQIGGLTGKYIELVNANPELGISPEQFMACQSDQELLNRINATSAFGSSEFGVNATPTFLFNGEPLLPSGRRDFEAFQQVLDRLAPNTGDQ